LFPDALGENVGDLQLFLIGIFVPNDSGMQNSSPRRAFASRAEDGALHKFRNFELTCKIVMKGLAATAC
jgi:hypothetical protein